MNHLVWSLAFLLAVVTLNVYAESCPDNDQPCRHCGPGARCAGSGKNRRCECRNGLSSEHPSFNCFDHSKDKSCYFVWDPQIKAFSDDKGPFDFIGSTRLVNVTTTNPKRPFGTCHFQMWGWTSKYRGKLYLSGLAFEQRIDFISGKVHELDGEINGEADGCHYKYTTYMWTPGNNPFMAGSTFSKNDAIAFARRPWECGVSVTRVKGNFLMAQSPCCGIEFGIRVFHEGYPDRMPGMYALVADKHNPVFDFPGNDVAPLCMDINKDTSFKGLKDDTAISDRQSALTYQAITNSDYTDYENVPANLSVLKNALKSCSLRMRKRVFSKADFMFRDPSFIGCSSSNDEEYVNILVDLVNYICNKDSASCESMRDSIVENCPAAKIDAIPGLRELLDSC